MGSGDVNTTLMPSNATFSQQLNTTTDDVDDNNLRLWRVGLYAVGGLVIACLGIVGNIISIVVLAHFRKKGSAHFLLITLSIFDTIYLIAELVLENLTFMAQDGLINDNYRVFVRPVYGTIFPVPEMSKLCVSYIVITITLERYVAVVWPFKVHLVCRRPIAVVAVVVITITAILYHIPFYMAFSYKYTWNNSTQSDKFRFYRTEFGMGHFYNRIYHTWINLTAKFIVPFIILFLLNVHMIWTLKRTRVVVTSKNREQQDHKLTIMIVSMIVIFFFCSLFPAISHIITTGLNKYTECSIACNRFSAVADLLRIVNSAINFAIYCAMGKNFRNIFKELFCLCRIQTTNSTCCGILRKKRKSDATNFQSNMTSTYIIASMYRTGSANRY